MNLDDFLKVFKENNKFDDLNGLEFNVLKPGHIEYFFAVSANHVSFKDVCHGGAISGLMDATLGLAALSAAVPEQMLVSTVEFKLNFIRPAHIGEKLIGIGEVEHVGKSLIISKGHLYLEDRKTLIAQGLGTFNKYPMSKKVEYESK